MPDKELERLWRKLQSFPPNHRYLFPSLAHEVVNNDIIFACERLSTRSVVDAETRALKVLFHITEAHSQGGWVEQSETQRWNSLPSFQPTAGLVAA